MNQDDDQMHLKEWEFREREKFLDDAMQYHGADIDTDVILQLMPTTMQILNNAKRMRYGEDNACAYCRMRLYA